MRDLETYVFGGALNCCCVCVCVNTCSYTVGLPIIPTCTCTAVHRQGEGLGCE